MLTDGEANAQDSGKMQQEAFSLATILLSKLEKHSAPKQGKHTHTDGRAAASPGADCVWGSKNQLHVRGGPGQDGTGIKSPLGGQGSRQVRGSCGVTSGLAALPLEWSK